MSERFCPCGAVASGFAERLLYRPGRFIYVAESNTYRYPGEGGVMQNRLVEAQPGETAPRQMHAESATAVSASYSRLAAAVTRAARSAQGRRTSSSTNGTTAG